MLWQGFHDQPVNGASVAGFGVTTVVTLVPAPQYGHPGDLVGAICNNLGGQTSWRQVNK